MVSRRRPIDAAAHTRSDITAVPQISEPSKIHFSFIGLNIALKETVRTRMPAPCVQVYETALRAIEKAFARIFEDIEAIYPQASATGGRDTARRALSRSTQDRANRRRFGGFERFQPSR